MIATLCIMAATAAAADPAARPNGAVKLIAHRGESHLAPENTLAAVELAWKLGDDAVEIDCHLTADRHLVVCHDKDTARTAGRNLLIGDSTLAALRELDVGRWKGEQWAGQKIPTLAEVLSTVPDGKQLLVEMKVGPDAVPALKQAVETSGKQAEQIVIIGFHPPLIAEAKRQLPQCRAMLLIDRRPNEHNDQRTPSADELIAAVRAVGADALNVSWEPPLERATVERIRAAGLPLYVWTVDSPDEARRLIELGIDGITTNRAAWMREQLAGVEISPIFN